MKLSNINARNKNIINFNEREFVWDSWDWHSPSYKFKYLSRKNNTLKIEVWEQGWEQHISGQGSFISAGYQIGSWESKGIVKLVFPMEFIEKSENYEKLMRNRLMGDNAISLAKNYVKRNEVVTIKIH